MNYKMNNMSLTISKTVSINITPKRTSMESISREYLDNSKNDIKYKRVNNEYEKSSIIINIGNIENEISLSDAFKNKRKSLVERFEQKEKSDNKQTKAKLTKEELFIRRKTYMHPKNNIKRKNNFLNSTRLSLYLKKKEPSPEFIARLTSGLRRRMSKEEMYKLTEKNYKLLPEVQMKNKLDRKKLEDKSRIDRIQKLRKVFNILINRKGSY